MYWDIMSVTEGDIVIRKLAWQFKWAFLIVFSITLSYQIDSFATRADLWLTIKYHGAQLLMWLKIYHWPDFIQPSDTSLGGMYFFIDNPQTIETAELVAFKTNIAIWGYALPLSSAAICVYIAARQRLACLACLRMLDIVEHHKEVIPILEENCRISDRNYSKALHERQELERKIRILERDLDEALAAQPPQRPTLSLTLPD